MGTSATLMERSKPYHVQIELARGKVNQLRGQLSDWLGGGLEVPAAVLEQVRAATLAFSRAVTQGPVEQAEAQAQQALTLAYAAADQLVRLYVDQVFRVRQQRMPRLDTTLGCRLASARPGAGAGPGSGAGSGSGAGPGSPDPAEAANTALLGACNTVCLPLAWNEIEPAEADYNWGPQDALLDWAQSKGLPVSAGPLIDFSKARLPDWLWLWEGDLPSLASFMCDYVETAIKRYRGRIHSWQLTGASNYAALLGLSEDELLWLTVRMVEAARQSDPTLDLVIGIAQPWGDYMAVEDRTHSPFVFADTLIRSGLNLAALDLELVMGVAPRGSYCRDLLETSRLLDMYALLGVPLRVTLGYPSADAPDPAADPELRVAAGSWHGSLRPDIQADWATAFAELAICKPAVQGILWTHFSDAQPHQFPHCGLVDAEGNLKPALERLRQLREKRLR
jgi:hypothetical protein